MSSPRSREAFKIGLAMAVAMGIALWMDWEKPVWAGFSVAMISQSTAGQSLNKGAMRMLGTLVAMLAALTLLAWFPQQRFAFMAVLSLYVGVCAYMMTSRKRPYFWFVSGFVCVVIAVSAHGSLGPFGIAVERAQETGLGILVYSLVSVLLWPITTRDGLESASRDLLATQVRLFRTYWALMLGEGRHEDSRPLRMQEVQLSSRADRALDAAQTDSYEVWEVRGWWCHVLQQSTLLMKTLERWRATFPEIQTLALSRIFPNLESVGSELDRRFGQIESILAGQAPDPNPEPSALTLDPAEIRALGHFQRAALAVTKGQIDRLDVLSRSLVQGVRNLRGLAGSREPGPPGVPARPRLDLDRLQGVVTVLATLWIGFLIWVYIDPPGHAGFTEIATILAMVTVMLGQNPLAMWLPFALGTLFSGALYVFVMPLLSGYAELGSLIFCATFGITYLFWKPEQALGRMAGLVTLVTFLSVQNQQTYSFASYANSAAMFLLAIGLVIAMTYLPPSPRPEKVFLRLLRRFFRHAEFLVSRLAVDREQSRSLADRWKARVYRDDLLELPVKLTTLAHEIDYRALPGTRPESVLALVASLHALALRLRDVVETRGDVKDDLLLREVRGDLNAWRQIAQDQFRLWARDPSADLDAGEEAGSRLAARLTRMEARLDAAYQLPGVQDLPAEERESFYRLLGGSRGFSEATIGYARLARGIDWTRWREARF
jgi:uncharacterized membrane protein YccC